jgi:hypothetical protein
MARPLILASTFAASIVAAPAGAEPARSEAFPSPDARLDVPLVHSLGLMTVMRTTEAVIWPKPFADFDLLDWAGSYGRALREPPKWDVSAAPFEWDGDAWPINVIGHGVFGSELYFRARHCQNGVLGALAFATLASATWDYVYEGNRVQPSGLDLWYTPTAGILFGELRHQGWRAAGGIDSPFWRGTVRAILDPLGSFERWAGAPC